MTVLANLLAELDVLNTLELNIIQRVWDQSNSSVDLEGTALTESTIKARVDALAGQLVESFPDANPVLVGLMDGAAPFAALLGDALHKRNYQFNYTTMSVSSYGHAMVSGSLSMGNLPKVELIGRTVIVVDDVCDTGKTLKAIKDTFIKQHPKTVKLMVLVDKAQDRPQGYNPDYVGFRLSQDAFIIGMGLDYRQGLRNKPSIKTANPESLPTVAEELVLAKKEEVLAKIRAIIKLEQGSKKLVSPGAHSIFALNDLDVSSAAPADDEKDLVEAVVPA